MRRNRILKKRSSSSSALATSSSPSVLQQPSSDHSVTNNSPIAGSYYNRSSSMMRDDRGGGATAPVGVGGGGRSLPSRDKSASSSSSRSSSSSSSRVPPEGNGRPPPPPAGSGGRITLTAAAAPQVAPVVTSPPHNDTYERRRQIQEDYAYFVKNTYSRQCALLGHNFHIQLCSLGIYDLVPYDQDTRLVSVTLMYIFYKYQLHPCDIALNLATTLIYLQDTPKETLIELGQLGHNAFNLVVYHTYLAHAWNDDVTIKLKDWYNEVGRLYFPSIAAMNDYVWAVFSKGRQFHLFVEERRVGRYVKKLCSLPM